MKIRSARRTDIPQIRELSRLFFMEQAGLQPNTIQTDSYEEQFLLDIINSDMSEILLAEENERVIGFAILIEKETVPSTGQVWHRFAHLKGLMVASEHRGSGIGSQFIQKSKEWARRRDLAYIELNVLAENDNASRLYVRTGFQNILHTMRCAVERLPTQEAVERILFNNDATLEMYFSLLAGGELWDGRPHRLYFDAEKRMVIFRRGAAGEDASTPMEAGLYLLHQTCEIKQLPREDLYDPDNDCRSLKNYGYDEWREEVRRRIVAILETRITI